MSTDPKISWFDDFLGIAYRYYDLRMNIVPLFSDRKIAANFWNENIRWWNDHTIKVRFVEDGDDYWVIIGAESRKPENNQYIFKRLPKSSHYERFKKGHAGSAYLRLGIYTKKYIDDVKYDAICDCSHAKEDHSEEQDDDSCLYEDCNCKKFESFQVDLLKKKKTITDIQFLDEQNSKDDSLSWNCLTVNKYNKTDKS